MTEITEQLRSGQREIELPATLTLADGQTLQCLEVLRLLPRKRAVMKARWQGQTVLVKLMLNTMSGRRGIRRELAGFHSLKNATITTPNLLLTAQDSNGNYILIFEFIEQTVKLFDRWLNKPEQRVEIASTVLGLIARLHRKGCQHTDPHLNNFLLIGDQIYVVDVASIKHRRGTRYSQWQRKNLAFFLSFFPPLQRTILLEQLVLNYAEATTDAKLEQAVDQQWQKRKSRYLKKCLRECSEFSRHANWYQVAVWKRARYCDDLISFMQNPDAWVKKGEVLKDGNSSTVVRMQMEGQAVAIKRNNINTMHRWLRYCLRPTRSYHNWRSAHLLLSNDIATPEPIAFVEKRWGPFRWNSYYVCAFSDSELAAKKYVSEVPTECELAQFKELFRTMRSARLYHGDLKATNILVAGEGVMLLDLDAVKDCWTKKNLELFLQKDCRRFLKNWEDNPLLLKIFSEIFK